MPPKSRPRTRSSAGRKAPKLTVEQERIAKTFNRPRDPARIGRILQKLGELWSLKPDLRFGQLVRNLPPGDVEKIDFAHAGMTELAVFEDDRWEQWIDRALEQARKKQA